MQDPLHLSETIVSRLEVWVVTTLVEVIVVMPLSAFLKMGR